MIKRIIALFKAKDSKQLYMAYCMVYNYKQVADDIYKQYKLNGGMNYVRKLRTN